ncbi:MAG: ATP-binding cassette domain-containing protein [Gammaproteobacteria bacterium]|jgi:ABC-2 type transport system ATP-binding protein|nr:ATP-binding cassette domain-containing protein [Gammaproteobacteria bacterium]
MSTDSLICVEHLYRYYGPLCAVDDISFEVRRGEVLGFLGPNGAGKSTTMQIISGNLAPSAGRVLVNGADILDQPRRAKTGLGYLPDQPPLYREMTVDEYLWYCARIKRIPRGASRAAIERVKERCGLGAVGARVIGNLSKGYQQRVGIAQAIVHAPDVVILDEPTVGLDPIQIREIRALIRELGGDHAVILSTHILPEVQAVCDRVQVIHRGRLVFDDSIEGLQRHMFMSWLTVAMHNAPPAATLAALPDVVCVEDMGGGHMRLQYRPEAADFPERMVARAVAEGWRLHEIAQERRSLEEIFVDLTRAEEAAA